MHRLYSAPEETKAGECFFPERLSVSASVTAAHDTWSGSHFQLPAREFLQSLLMPTVTEEPGPSHPLSPFQYFLSLL